MARSDRRSVRGAGQAGRTRLRMHRSDDPRWVGLCRNGRDRAAPRRRVLSPRGRDRCDGGSALFLAFGAIGGNADVGVETAALGQLILAALERHGIRASWNGSAKERIRIEPFEWRRRRWTQAPSYELAARPLESSKRPSLLSRIFGKRSPPPAASPEPHVEMTVSAPRCGKVIRALRSENGFNVRRAREMRAAWRQRGMRATRRSVTSGSRPPSFRPDNTSSSRPSSRALISSAKGKRSFSAAQRHRGNALDFRSPIHAIEHRADRT